MLNLRADCLSASKHKKLPSINNQSSKANDSSILTNSAPSYQISSKHINESNTNKNIETVFDLKASKNHIDINAILNSELSNLSAYTMPKTDNKKKPPQKIQSIEPHSYNHKIMNRNNYNTAVTIDILSESDRFSRLSLDPLTYREASSSRFSSVS
jgi:hypothetical protein